MTNASTADDLDPTDLKWIGPATAEVFSGADFTADHVANKDVSYQMLVDAGVNPGVAAKIRREHSLSWSFEAGDGLSERSAQVRGLGSDEAAWVEASSSGDWEEEADEEAPEAGASDEDAWVAASSEGTADEHDEPPTAGDDAAYFTATADTDGSIPDAEADGSGDPAAAEAAWRERSEPTPVTDLDPVDEEAKDLLADAGITSVRSLATADPEHVADVLDIDQERVTAWHDAARDAEE